jgi:hypothetical protein
MYVCMVFKLMQVSCVHVFIMLCLLNIGHIHILLIFSSGVERGQGVTLPNYPHLMPRSRMSRSFTSSSPSASMACSGTAFYCAVLTLFYT